jgi:hypothetical protein
MVHILLLWRPPWTCPWGLPVSIMSLFFFSYKSKLLVMVLLSLSAGISDFLIIRWQIQGIGLYIVPLAKTWQQWGLRVLLYVKAVHLHSYFNLDIVFLQIYCYLHWVFSTFLCGETRKILSVTRIKFCCLVVLYVYQALIHTKYLVIIFDKA